MQCGPGVQLTADFSKMQGLGAMGGAPMQQGPDNDMGHFAEMPPEAMQPMMEDFAHMTVGTMPMAGNIASAAPTALSASAPYVDPLQFQQAATMQPMMQPYMMGPGMMMGGMGMMGPMYPHMMQPMMMPMMQGIAPIMHQPQMQAPVQQQPQTPAPAPPSIEAMLAEPLDEGAWMQQFRSKDAPTTEEEQAAVQTFGNEGEDLQSVEDKTTNSQFYGFMEKVNDGKIVIDEDNGGITEVDRPSEANDWAAQLAAAQAHVDAEYGPQMANYVPDPATEAWRATEAAGGLEGNMLDTLQEQWNEGEEVDEEFYDAHADGEAWAREYKELLGQFTDPNNSDYPFEPENAFMFHDDPLGEGKRLLALGILSDAVLAFEAACQQDGGNHEAWKLLGTTQAENEKDNLAIRALNKAKQIDPRDKDVYMALSVSHANESQYAFALEALRGWLLAQPEYDMLVDVVASMNNDEPQPVVDDDDADYATFMNMMDTPPKEMKDLTTLFGAAMEMNPMDSALHVALGIAHHLSHDFESAITCFRTALELSPEDAKVWNKLGATLANSSKSEEAIHMYENALNINPGYVRARYNLGIAYNNLGNHQMAAENFARAIVMQQGGVGDGSAAAGGPPRSTREMWDALKTALNLLNRTDLVQHAWKQEIAPILQELGLSDLAF